MANLDSVIIKKQQNDFADKGPYSQSYGFPVGMYGCESWTINKAEHWTDAFELWFWKRLESFLDSKEIKPVSLKGNQHWIFTKALMLKLKLH